MSQASFEQFRQLVLKDLALQKQLQEPADLETFLPIVMQLGRERGLDISAADVETAARQARQAWLERWI